MNDNWQRHIPIVYIPINKFHFTTVQSTQDRAHLVQMLLYWTEQHTELYFIEFSQSLTQFRLQTNKKKIVPL